MDKGEILAALRSLAVALEASGITGDLFVVGGAAIAVAYDARRATRDVDAVFAPKQAIYEAAARIADGLGLPADWLNDAVKGFLPAGVARPGSPDPDAVPVFDEPGLRVMAASPRYLLAMKLLAARREDEADIRWLCSHLGITTADEALGVLCAYYPDGQVLPRTQFLVEELLAPGGRDPP